ncbi:MAG: segregation and condensation protein A, partial [Phycisphaeraceae bacterium]
PRNPNPETTPVSKDYTVHLDAYEGPLDLLLHLVKRHEVDLLDIPIAELTDQYLDHVRVLKEIDVERAGDFLLMAATLLEIKSRMLSPRMLGEDEGEETDLTEDAGDSADDPRYELVQQLLAYKKYKDAAVALEDRHETWAHRAPARARPAPADPDADAAPVELDVDDLHVMDLCQAFGRMLDSIGQPRTHDVAYDETPIALHAADIEDRLARDGGPEQRLTLRQICEGRANRAEMIGLFLAMLELVRECKVAVVQDDQGEVGLRLIPEDQRDDPAANPTPDAAQPAPAAEGEPLDDDAYHWPDPAGRQRHERRQRLRAARARGEPTEDSEDDASEEADSDVDASDAEDADNDAEGGEDDESRRPQP